MPGDGTGAFVAAKTHVPEHHLVYNRGATTTEHSDFTAVDAAGESAEVNPAGPAGTQSRLQSKERRVAPGRPSLAATTVNTVDGDSVTLGSLIDRPTALVIPRYYGWLPCRDYLRQVSERYDEVEAAGGAALGVSVGPTSRHGG
jgi:hypothetical protein